MNDQNLKFANLIKSASEIKTKYFTSRFKDPKLEENYLSHLLQNMKNLTVTYMILLILTYVAMIIYGSFVIKIHFFFIVNSICLLLTLIFTLIYLLIDSPIIKSYIELTCFFLLSVDLITNSYSFKEMNYEDYRALRIIYILIILKNLSLLIWSQTVFIFWLLFSLLNITYFILCITVFKFFNTSLIDEIAIEILTSLLSFGIKKFFDSVLRITFLERIKLKNYFDYNKKLINCMSGLHITFSGNRLIYMNDNTKSLLSSLMENENNCESIF